MDQMADEMTLSVRDKGRVKTAEESSVWVRGEWRLGEPSGKDCEEASRGEDCDDSPSSLFSLQKHQAGSACASSLSSQQNNMGVDCAEMVLNCLFCRFYDMILMLPASCERVANDCCPSYKQMDTTAESASSRPTHEDSCIDLDCALLTSCQDAGDCLELAMEISEVCYH